MRYVVQKARLVEGERDMSKPSVGDVSEVWVDIATVEVEPRTKRSTVLKKALAESGIVPAKGETLRLRALDADSAEVHEPEAYQPPMEWKL